MANKKLIEEIKQSLSNIDNVVTYYMTNCDNQDKNSVIRELRKIHKRLDKLTPQQNEPRQ